MTSQLHPFPRLGRVADKPGRFPLKTGTPASAAAAALELQISHTSYYAERPDQGGYGCCVSEAWTAVIMAEMLRYRQAEPPDPALSVRANYYQSQINSYPPPVQDDGLPSGAGGTTYEHNGFVLNSDWPFPDPQAPVDEASFLRPVPKKLFNPSFENFDFFEVPNDVNSMRLALLEHVGLVIGTYWAKSWYYPVNPKDTSGILQPPDTVVGGHALVIAAANDRTGLFTVGNSWGTDWGVKPPGAVSSGWCYLPYSFAKDYPQFWPGDVYAVSIKKA